MMLTIYLFDLLFNVEFWRSWCGFVVGAGISLLTFGSVLLGVDAYAYGPLCLFALALPLWLLVIRRCCGEATTSDFVRWLIVPLALAAVITAVCWGWWTWQDENNWRKARKRYGQRLSNNGLACRRTYEESWMTDDEIDNLEPYSRCQEVFLLWVTPWCVACILGVLGGAAYYASLPNAGHKLPNKFVAIICLLLVGGWCAASLAGAGNGIASAMLAVLVALILGLFLIALSQFGGGITELKDSVRGSKAFQSFRAKYVDPFPDVWRGLFVIVLGPIFVFGYLPLEFLRQRVRRCRRIALSRGWFTDEAREQLDIMREWNWTKVCNYACLIGFANIAVVVVVAKFTVLAMSLVVARCENMSIVNATGIIAGVGMTLFLLPPVPGAPIYLAAGVLLVVVTRSNGWPVQYGIAYSAGVSLVIKLVACTCQQKLIGEPMRKSVWVRKTVGINTPLIRTTRLVLAERGLSIAKVALLVGGPDWPTSVLCGILGLRLAPVLVGTLPVWLLIWPTVLGGAFLVISESYSQVLSAIFIGLAALVQSGSLLVAAVYLNAEAEKRKDELSALPYDPEVLAEAERDAVKKKLYEDATRWKSKHIPVSKCLLAAAVVLLQAACYLTTLYPSACFRDFAVDDTVSEKLKGRWTRLIKLPGLVAICLFGAALIFYFIFEYWACSLVTNSDVDIELQRGAPSSRAENKQETPDPRAPTPTNTRDALNMNTRDAHNTNSRDVHYTMPGKGPAPAPQLDGSLVGKSEIA